MTDSHSKDPAATDGQAAAGIREFITVGSLLFAPVLLGFATGTLGGAVGWIISLTLLWSSTRWSLREKVLATLVWPGGLAPALVLATTPSEVCEHTAGSAEVCTGSTLPIWLGVPVLALSIAAPMAVSALLLRRASNPRPSPPRRTGDDLGHVRIGGHG